MTPDEITACAAVAQGAVILAGTIIALCHYRKDMRQRTFRDSIELDQILGETRRKLTSRESDNFELDLLNHVEWLEIIASALNKKYLAGMAKEFAEDALRNDLAGLVYIVERDSRGDLISHFVTSDETFQDIAQFYRSNKPVIHQRATALRR